MDTPQDDKPWCARALPDYNEIEIATMAVPTREVIEATSQAGQVIWSESKWELRESIPVLEKRGFKLSRKYRVQFVRWSPLLGWMLEFHGIRGEFRMEYFVQVSFLKVGNFSVEFKESK